MIEFTTGMIIMGISILGILGCLIALIITGPVFKRQRRKLLKRIETEEE